MLNDWEFLGDVSIHQKVFIDIYTRVFNSGIECSPRGQKVKELQNFNYIVPPYVRFINFKERNLNLPYIKNEFLWYLKGDEFDLSITDHAKIWKTCVDENNSIASNYGQYIFGKQNQFDFIVNELKNDKDSRRASIVILNYTHLKIESRDIPCTYSLNFRIRDNKLNMTVRMRSQDAVYGMTNDIPCFSFIHEMLFTVLHEYYPNLIYGTYYHSVDSFHIYEKHYEMINNIVNKNIDTFSLMLCPKMFSVDEVNFLRCLHTIDYQNTVIPIQYKFTNWLISNK